MTVFLAMGEPVKGIATVSESTDIVFKLSSLPDRIGRWLCIKV
jgi:hypothetical protein